MKPPYKATCSDSRELENIRPNFRIITHKHCGNCAYRQYAYSCSAVKLLAKEGMRQKDEVATLFAPHNYVCDWWTERGK